MKLNHGTYIDKITNTTIERETIKAQAIVERAMKVTSIMQRSLP